MANSATRRISAGGATAWASAPIRPGDVASTTIPCSSRSMVFMIHPNQYLPETGYLLCGEPVLLTAHGAEPLTQRQAALAEIGSRLDAAAMQTMHPTLLVGPADWDPLRIPQEEFDARSPTLWRDHPSRAAAPSSTATPANHAELAYLTNFTPKLEAAMALIPRDGDAATAGRRRRQHAAGGKAADLHRGLAPLRDVGKTVAEWAAGLDARRKPRSASAAHSMPYELHQARSPPLGGRRVDKTARTL